MSANRGEGVGDMTVSNTESGYLTDSVTSSKDTDSTACVDGAEKQTLNAKPLNNCENLMTFSDSSSSASLLSPDGDITIKEQFSCNKSDPDETTDSSKAENSRIKQLESLASLDLNDVSQDMSSIDDIFTTNFASSPNGNIPAQAQSESNSESGQTSREKNVEGRKRSKSSAFPIARQKEGVNITEELLSKSLPHGKVVRRDTGLIEFIADDLQEKIRRSSPMSKTGVYL